MVPDTLQSLQALSAEIEALCDTAHWCAARGWVPATSGNFSVRAATHIHITATGLDKSSLKPADLLEIDTEGRATGGHGRPSAETGLHTVIYRERPQAHAILHVHSIWNTLLSAHFASTGYVPLEGYELLKGLAGVTTHMHMECVPVIENSQDYAALAAELRTTLESHPQAHGVLLSRHGFYTWGQSVAEARRHLEALEFLFEVEGQRLLFRHSTYGDLTPCIAGYFDTRTGAKGDSASYAAIAAGFGVAPAEVLFFSDAVRELDAAGAAGCQTRLMVRPGNARVDDAHGHAVLESFALL